MSVNSSEAHLAVLSANMTEGTRMFLQQKFVKDSHSLSLPPQHIAAEHALMPLCLFKQHLCCRVAVLSLSLSFLAQKLERKCIHSIAPTPSTLERKCIHSIASLDLLEVRHRQLSKENFCSPSPTTHTQQSATRQTCPAAVLLCVRQRRSALRTIPRRADALRQSERHARLIFCQTLS